MNSKLSKLLALVAVTLMVATVFVSVEGGGDVSATTPANDPNSVVLGTTSIDRDTLIAAPYNFNDTCGASTGYDATTGTLTLENVTFTANDDSYNAIVANKDVTIVVKGENVINCGSPSAGESTGIYADQTSVTITGSADSSLKIVTHGNGKVPEKGIYVEEADTHDNFLSVKGGVHLEIQCPINAGYSADGINAQNVSISEKSYVKIDIADGSETGDGIYQIQGGVSGTSIDDSTVEVTVGNMTGDYSSYGIYGINDLSIVNQSTVTVSKGNCSRFSYAIASNNGNVTISDSTVSAIAGTGMISRGICSENGTISIERSNIVAKGHTSAFDKEVTLPASEYKSIKGSTTYDGELADIPSSGGQTAIGTEYKYIDIVSAEKPTVTSSNSIAAVVAIVVAILVTLAAISIVIVGRRL